MSEYGQISATVRTTHGKGAARQLRRKGLVPAVMYGAGGENLSLTLDPHLFRKATDPTLRYNTLFQITFEKDGAPQTVPCMIADIQTDSIRDDVVHIDFLRVDLDREIERKVPVRYFGRSPGVVAGGRLKTFRRIVQISAKPGEIPEELAVDITPLESGQYLRISDMSLPGASFVEPPNAPLAFIDPPKTAKVEEEVVEVVKKGKK